MPERQEEQVKKLLLKEAQSKREHQKQVIVNRILLREAEARFASVLKEAMPRGAGQSTLKNSGWNTVWDWHYPSDRVRQIQDEIEKEFSPYFYSILEGRHQPVKAGITISSDQKRPDDDVPDGSIYFRFAYRRAVMPLDGRDPAQKSAYESAQNAMGVLEETLPGFGAFKNAIESNNIPLQPYYHESEFGSSAGGLTKDKKGFFLDFISRERQRHAQGIKGARTSHFYKQHDAMINEMGDIPVSRRHARKKIFSNFDIPNVATFNDLLKAIQTKVKDGYTLDVKGLTRTIQEMIRGIWT